FAHGLAPDLLTSIYLATPAPVLLAPAMNGKMLAHPATQANISILRDRGHSFVEPTEGLLACGYEGRGKLAPVAEIVAAAESILSESRG
ncbi:MAG: phosphopantothenoylcysteine decarboxylase, partial [Puniceicoccaceae bacterium]